MEILKSTFRRGPIHTFLRGIVMNKHTIEFSEIKTEILHASISLDNEISNKSKKDNNIRMLKARRAIEAYQEEKQLHDAIADGWDYLD